MALHSQRQARFWTHDSAVHMTVCGATLAMKNFEYSACTVDIVLYCIIWLCVCDRPMELKPYDFALDPCLRLAGRCRASEADVMRQLHALKRWETPATSRQPADRISTRRHVS